MISYTLLEVNHLVKMGFSRKEAIELIKISEIKQIKEILNEYSNKKL